MRTWIVIGTTALMLGCGSGTDTDAGPGMDSGPGDTDAGSDAGSDAGPDFDAGPLCMDMMVGACADGATECLCCPAGGPAQNCLCTTRCSDDAECTDPTRPTCNRPMGGGGGAPPGICTPPAFTCAWGAVCASPDTPIATPTGERPIAELEVGDLVLTMDRGALVPRPLVRVNRMPVTDHAVVRTVLDSGRVLRISGPHPTADGRLFSDLAPGDRLDESLVVEVSTEPYLHAFTYDILPAGDSGAYVAAGELIGSTLTPNMDSGASRD